jgi:hypothetical protein
MFCIGTAALASIPSNSRTCRIQECATWSAHFVRPGWPKDSYLNKPWSAKFFTCRRGYCNPLSQKSTMPREACSVLSSALIPRHYYTTYWKMDDLTGLLHIMLVNVSLTPPDPALQMSIVQRWTDNEIPGRRKRKPELSTTLSSLCHT